MTGKLPKRHSAAERKRRINMLERDVFLTMFMAFFVTVIIAPMFIPFLRRLKFGQSIREEGPESHQKNPVHRRWAALFSCSLSL